MTSSPWKWSGNYGRKNLFKENGKKIATRGIFGGFLRNFRKSCLLPLVVDARSAENIRLIFQPMHADLLKNPILIFLFRFCTENSYFFAIKVLFESALNWLSVGNKISTVGWFPEEHLQFINENSF